MEQQQSTGVTPGTQSSEYRLANRASWIGIVTMVLGIVVELAYELVELLTPLAAQLPNARWLGIVLLVCGAIVKVATSVGYSRARATVKAAASVAQQGGKVLLLLVGLSLAVPASAQDLSPKFGGCLKDHPGTCFAPAVSVNLVAMRLRDGDLVPTFDPGLGYGVTFWSKEWYRTGAALTASFPQYEGSRRIEPAGTLTFAEYARIGISCPLYVAGGFRENARLLLGFGANFGSW